MDNRATCLSLLKEFAMNRTNASRAAEPRTGVGPRKLVEFRRKQF
jgi:hypothetical protein